MSSRRSSTRPGPASRTSPRGTFLSARPATPEVRSSASSTGGAGIEATEFQTDRQLGTERLGQIRAALDRDRLDYRRLMAESPMPGGGRAVGGDMELSHG